MGDKAVISRRNLRNAIDRNAAEGGVGRLLQKKLQKGEKSIRHQEV